MVTIVGFDGIISTKKQKSKIYDIATHESSNCAGENHESCMLKLPSEPGSNAFLRNSGRKESCGQVLQK